MADVQSLQRDLNELLQRIGVDGRVARTRDGEADSLSTALAIPTLAERGLAREAVKAADQLISRRDHTGAWDDTWTTIIALEALVALKLRAIDVKDADDAIDQAVNVVRGFRPLEPAEHELRLARSIVLAGLAHQTPSVIDAGLLRVRSAMDRGITWSAELDVTLHGLLALVDLFTITSDVVTKTVIDERIGELKIAGDTGWAKGQSVGTISRCGTILEKLNHRDDATRAYDLACAGGAPEALETLDLKLRIELGARLHGSELASISRNVEVETTPETASGTAEKPESSEPKPTSSEVAGVHVENLPALSPGALEQPHVSAVVVQRGDASSVTDTIDLLKEQTYTPEELVVVWTGRSNDAFDYPGDVVHVHAAEGDGIDHRWRSGITLARGTWIWTMTSGSRPGPDSLSRMLSAANGEVKAVHLSTAPGELENALSSLKTKPSLCPERVLANRELVTVSRPMPELTADPFWGIALDRFTATEWREVVEDERSRMSVPEPGLDELAGRIEDAFALKRRFPSTHPEERQARHEAFEAMRDDVYTVYNRQSTPFASIVIYHNDTSETLERCIYSIVDRTHEIPFEVIALLDTGETPRPLVATLEHMGVLVVEKMAGEKRSAALNRGAGQARGRYIAFVDSTIEVQEGWLTALVHAMQEEDRAGAIGAQIQAGNGTIAHVGIAFAEGAVPVALHAGGPLVLSHIHKRRPYQAVSGLCMLVRTSLFKRLKGMEEQYQHLYEDFDFCLRARQLGQRIYYEPRAQVVQHPVDEKYRLENGSSDLAFWRKRWSDVVDTDVQQYAHLDGYTVQMEKDRVRLVPMGAVMKSAAREESMGTNRGKSTSGREPDKPAVPAGKSLAELLTEVETLFKNGRFDVAEEALVKGQSQVNGNVRSRVMYWTLLGDARFRLDKPEEAYQCYSKAVKDDPSAERAWIGIGTYHLVKGDLDKAEQIFSRVISLNPANMRGHLGLGNVNLRRGNPNEALPFFLKATELSPEHRPAIVGLVAAAVQAEKMSEATPALEAYLQLQPSDYEARFHLAAILFGTSDRRRAREEAVKVLEAKPDHRGARELLEHIPDAPSAS